MSFYFRRLLRRWCWEQTRYEFGTDKTAERMLNHAKMIEDYIADGKVPAWSKAVANGDSAK